MQLRTLTLRFLHFVQPYRDFLCGLRVLCSVVVPFSPVSFTSILVSGVASMREVEFVKGVDDLQRYDIG